jgi:hypothetical protein
MTVASTLALGTGLPELDRLLRGLIAGDNLVWRVDRVEDYASFARPYADFGVEAGRPVVYFRFARHAPVLDGADGGGKIERHDLDPATGFEPFLDAVHTIIERTPRGAYYVFDSLSELAAIWYSDQMLCNFFMLTCPYLYDRGDIAYFGLMRDRHSNEAVLPIRETCQVMIDVHASDGAVYLRPIKTQQRFSATMHMLHRWEDGHPEPITASHTIAQVLRPAPPSAIGCAVRPIDAWNRAFLQVQDLLLGPKELLNTEIAQHLFESLLRMVVSREERVLQLARRHFTLADLLDIGRRVIGTGMIGGKSVGMLLAHAILRNSGQRWAGLLELHDSFYIGSDLFYTYLVRNGCWWMRRRQKTAQDVIEGAEQVRRRILTGKFSKEAEDELARMLDYFGCSPIIVRSSSLLEDAFGNSFAGKYESVFCANQGSFEQRMEDFKSAVRTVYASAMSEGALAYRKRHGLLDREEQMALLVQRVSGAQHGDLYFPDVAGVGFSFNPYVWSQDIDPDAGLLRLVFGLGTRAVDRSDDDYTRIIALNAPDKTPESGRAGGRRYSQRKVDILDLDANQLVSRDFTDIVQRCGGTSGDPSIALLARRDPELERAARERGATAPSPLLINFDRIVADSPFVEDMRSALSILQDAYDYPVDVEFTANFTPDGDCRVNVVQCRPLQVRGDAVAAPLPENVAEEDIILRCAGPVIGQSRSDVVDLFIYVVPEVYGKTPLADRYRIARLIGRIAHHEPLQSQGRIMLLGPGRWGTTSPELGVPVSFAEINPVSVLCEIVAMREDLVPDVSLGTHFFSELVEMEMLYLAVFPDQPETLINSEFFMSAPNLLAEMLPEAALFSDTIRVVRARDAAPGRRVRLHADVLRQHVLCFRDSSMGPAKE